MFMKPRLGFDSMWRVVGVGVYVSTDSGRDKERNTEEQTMYRHPEIYNKLERKKKRRILKGSHEEEIM